MTTQHPEALRLAAELDHGYPLTGDAISAAAELRTQHARITELEAQLSAIGAGGVSPLRNAAQETEATHLRELAAPSTDQVEEILRERDDADDFIDALLDEVLGPERPEWSSAYGRADALNDVRERMTALHKPAVDKAWDRFQSAMEAPQQPAPSPVPAGWKLVPVEPTEEMLKAADDGDDAYTLRCFGPGVQRVMQGPYDHYCAMLDAAPTAQADTQPAPVLDYPPLPEPDIAVCNGGKARIFTNKDIVGEPYYTADQMRAYVDSDRAARATADSVTAPAGGVDDAVDAIALARYKVVPAHESMFHRFAVVAGDGKRQLYLGREIECANMARKFAGAFLDGAFYQANIAPTPPAQAADSVLEDAARLDWLNQQCEGYGFQDIHEGNRWEISGPYANVRQAIDYERAARKQGEKQ